MPAAKTPRSTHENSEAAAAEKRFHRVLKAPSNGDTYLAALDDAMELRLKGAAKRR